MPYSVGSMPSGMPLEPKTSAPCQSASRAASGSHSTELLVDGIWAPRSFAPASLVLLSNVQRARSTNDRSAPLRSAPRTSASPMEREKSAPCSLAARKLSVGNHDPRKETPLRSRSTSPTLPTEVSSSSIFSVNPFRSRRDGSRIHEKSGLLPHSSPPSLISPCFSGSKPAGQRVSQL